MSDMVPFHDDGDDLPFHQLFRLMDHTFRNWASLLDGGMQARMQEQDSEYLLEIYLPGVNRQQINLRTSGNLLHVTVSHEAGHSRQDGAYNVRQQQVSSMQRSFALDNVQQDRISAQLQNGLLRVHLPKRTAGGQRYRDIPIA
ncbi:MAG: Hsp20 family protein [Eubacteriales bacterium]|nr:Hsp20 family protein [Eubacteriales bacterium]